MTCYHLWHWCRPACCRESQQTPASHPSSQVHVGGWPARLLQHPSVMVATAPTRTTCKISCSEKFFNQMSKPPATLFEGDVQGCHRFVSWVTPAIQFQRPPFTCALHVVYIQLVKRDPSHFGVHGGLIPVKKPTGNLHDQTLSKLPTYCLGDPRQFWHWLPRPSWASASGRLRALFMRALRITCDLVLGGSTANVKQHLLDLS